MWNKYEDESTFFLACFELFIVGALRGVQKATLFALNHLIFAEHPNFFGGAAKASPRSFD